MSTQEEFQGCPCGGCCEGNPNEGGCEGCPNAGACEGCQNADGCCCEGGCEGCPNAGACECDCGCKEEQPTEENLPYTTYGTDDDGYVLLTEDGGVKKKIIKEGTGDLPPAGSKVTGKI